MNPDGQPWILLRKLDRMVKRRARYHQARAGQHAFLEGANNRFVDLFGYAEIIRVDDQPKSIRVNYYRRLHITLCFGQKSTSAASTLCKGSARLSVGSLVLAAHRLAWAATNCFRFARNWRNSFASLYRRLRSCPLNTARRTILKMIRGRK